MYGEIASGMGGGGLGGLLGQVGDTLSAPRRYLWQALGLPEHGTDLMGQLGMDKDSLLTQGLGMGAEILGDPLTYAGSLIGLAGKLGGSKLLGMADASTNLGANVTRNAGVPMLGESRVLGGFNPAGKLPGYVPPGLGAAADAPLLSAQQEIASQLAREAAQARPQFQTLFPEAGRLPHDLAPPPSLDAMRMDARYAQMEEDARKGAAAEAMNPAREMGADPAGKALGRRAKALAALQDAQGVHYGAYGDLLQDVKSGAVSPQEALPLRLLMAGGAGTSEGQWLEKLKDPLRIVQRTPEQDLARQKMLRDTSVIYHLGQSGPEGAQVSLLKGISDPQGQALARTAVDANLSLQGYRGQGRVGSLPITDALQALQEGQLDPRKVSPLLTGIEKGLGLPADTGALGEQYLSSARRNMTNEMRQMLHDINEVGHPQPDEIENVLRMIGRENEVHLNRALATPLPPRPDHLVPDPDILHKDLQQRMREHMSPLLDALMGHVQKRAKL